MGKKPLQSAATRQKLIDAFWELYTVKGIEQISVKEITDSAGCNRGTFYLHFKDVYDLLNQIEDSLFPEGLLPQDEEDGCGPLTVRQMIEKMVFCYEQHSRYITVLLGGHGDPRFAYRLKEHYQTILELLPPAGDMDETSRRFFFEYCCGGIQAMISFWLNTNPRLSVEDFILLAIRVVLPQYADAILNQLDQPLDKVLQKNRSACGIGSPKKPVCP